MAYQKHFWVHIPFIGSMLDRIKPVLIDKSTATRSYRLKAMPYSTLFGRAYGPGPLPVAVAAIICAADYLFVHIYGILLQESTRIAVIANTPMAISTWVEFFSQRNRRYEFEVTSCTITV